MHVERKLTFLFSVLTPCMRVREQETYTAAGGHQQVAAQAYYMDSCQEDVSLAPPALVVQLGSDHYFL
jgi:hypothetical protein